MPSALQMPDITVTLGYTPNLFGAASVSTEIHEYVRAFNLKSGRQHELDQIQATILTMTLDNRSGNFAPWITPNTTVPLTTVSITAEWPQSSGSVYPIFFGYVNSVVEVSPDATNSDVTLQAFDVFGHLAQVNLNSSTCNNAGSVSSANGLYENAVLEANPVVYYILGPEYTRDYSGNGYTMASTIAGLSGWPNLNIGYGQAQGPILYNTATGISLGDNSSSGNPQGYFWVPVEISGGALEFWMQAPAKTSAAGLNGDAYIFESYDGNGTAFIAHFGSGSVSSHLTGADVTGGVVTARHNSSPVNFADGNWHHVVASSDGIIFDGNSVGGWFDGISGGGVFGGYYNPGGASVGASVAAWQPSYPGNLAQLAVYASAPGGHYTLGTYFQREVTSYERVIECLDVAGLGPTTGLQPVSDAPYYAVQGETSPVTGTTAFSYMVSCQQTEAGLLFVDPTGVITFYNRGHVMSASTAVVAFTDTAGSVYAGLPNCNYEPKPQIVRDDLDLWPIISVTRQNGITQVAANDAAVKQFGPRVGPTGGLSGLLFTTTPLYVSYNPDQASLDLANWLSQRYSASQVRIMSVDLASTANQGANLPHMLGLGLWNVVRFVRASAPGTGGPIGPGVFVQDNVIESIAHNVSMPDKWVTTYVLSPYQLLNS